LKIHEFVLATNIIDTTGRPKPEVVYKHIQNQDPKIVYTCGYTYTCEGGYGL
jgi:hypothetical protein